MACSVTLVSTHGNAQQQLEKHQQQSTPKIVSIGGAITEIIYALGEEDHLVGVDTTSSYPEAATQLPQIGYMRALSAEGVLSLNPDLVLAEGDAGPLNVIEVLQDAEINFIQLPDNHSLEAIENKIALIARKLNVTEKGDALISKFRSEVAALQQAKREVREEKSVMFILSLAQGRVMAAGRDTSIEAILNLAGANNVLENFSGFKPINVEAILNANPQIILTIGRGDHQITLADLQAHPSLSQTTAVKEENIISMNGLYLLGFGPRTAQAALDLHNAIYSQP